MSKPLKYTDFDIYELLNQFNRYKSRYPKEQCNTETL